MLVIKDSASLALVPDPAIRQMIQQRMDAIASIEPYNATLHGYFLVVQLQDALDPVNQQVGFDILSNRWTGLRYDHPEYTPAFEILEEYQTVWDLLFVVDQSGSAIELFICKDIAIPELLAMCQQHAVPGTL